MVEVTVIRVDLAKPLFQLHSAAADGSVIFRIRAPSLLTESDWGFPLSPKLIQTVCRGRRPTDMSKALSVDLRSRVVAVVKSGASHREAAARCGVSAASVSRWRRLVREQGDVRPGPLGGDRRSGRVEAQAELILSIHDETGDITIDERRAALAQRGHSFGYGTIHRFLKRRAITRKKRPATRSSRTARTF